MSNPFQYAYGIEYSNGRVTVVRATKRKRSAVFDVLATGMDAAADPAWKSIADTIQREHNSDRAMVAASANAQDSFIRPLATPFASSKKAAGVLPSLLDVQLPFPLEQCTYTFTHIHSSSDGNMRALAVAVPTERLRIMIEQLQSIGIDADVMDQEALALWRYTRKSIPPASSRTRVIIYLGYDRTLAVVGNDREPMTTFSARTPWNSEMDSTARERLALRLRQFLAGALHDKSDVPPEFIVSGPGAHAGTEQLQQNLDADPVRWRVTEKPDSWLAHALADGMLNPDDWCANLRSGALEHPNTRRRQEQSQQALCTTIAAASIILIVASLIAVFLTSRRHSDLQKSVQQAAATLTGSPYMPRGQELFLAGQYIKTSSENFTVFQQWLEPTAYPIFAEVLSISHQRNVQLDTLSARTESLLARGAGTDWNDPENISQPLSKRGWKVEVERNDAGTDERVHFTVRAQK